MRHALYFTPPDGSALARFGARAVGYDVATGAEVAPLSLPGLDPARVTAEPGRYGFHATLKAPFRLAPGGSLVGLRDALAGFAAGTPPVAIGRLAPRAIGRFVALVPVAPPPELGFLAAECVAAFEGFRAPLTAEDRARRLAAGLGERQRALLERWGYPHVFEAFRFHMTLTGPLDDAERGRALAALEEAYGSLVREPVTLDALSLVSQEAPGGRFRLAARLPLAGRPA